MAVYPKPSVYQAMQAKSFVAIAATASNNYHDFTMDRPVTQVVAQIQADSDGTINATGLLVTITTVEDTSCVVRVAATGITLADIINIVAW